MKSVMYCGRLDSGPYSNVSKRCDLCATEKLKIRDEDKSVSLNKRSELVSKCRHKNKYILASFISSVIKMTCIQ